MSDTNPTNRTSAALAGLTLHLAACAAPSSGGAGPPEAKAMNRRLVEATVTYTTNDGDFEGFLVRPAGEASAARPAVIVAHDFLGLGDYQRDIACKLADEGYVVLAADFYGRGRRPTGPEEANRFAMDVRREVARTRATMRAAYEHLVHTPGVDPERVVAMGYSVGGVAALELARAGVPLAGLIGLWPIVENASPADAHAIRAEVLVVVGDRDPLVSEESLVELRNELETAGTRHEIVMLPGVAHAFTVPAVGTDVASGFAYDARADAETWRRAVAFLARVAPPTGR